MTTVDLSALTVPTVTTVPRWDLYEALNVRSLTAGQTYTDPVTGQVILKLTDATTPAVNTWMAHSYSAGGFQGSHPITYGGRTYRTVQVFKPDSGASYFLDIDETTDEVFNTRPAPANLTTDLHVCFSPNVATPYICYYSDVNATKIIRFDVRTDTEAPNTAFPAGGADLTSLAPSTGAKVINELSCSYDERYFGGIVQGLNTSYTSTADAPRAVWYDSVGNVKRAWTNDRFAAFAVPTQAPLHSASLDRNSGTLMQLSASGFNAQDQSAIFWNPATDTWSDVVEIQNHADWVGSSGLWFSIDPDHGPGFYVTLAPMTAGGLVADPHTRIDVPGLADVAFGVAEMHYSGQWQQPGVAPTSQYALISRDGHNSVSPATWALDAGSVYVVSANGHSYTQARFYESVDIAASPMALTAAASRAAMVQGTFFMDAPNNRLYVWLAFGVTPNFWHTEAFDGTIWRNPSWLPDTGSIYKQPITFGFSGLARSGVVVVEQFDSPGKTTITSRLTPAVSKAAMVEGTYFHDTGTATLYVWPHGSLDLTRADVRLRPINPTLGEQGLIFTRIDGTDVRLLAHHYSSDPNSDNRYYNQSHATMSMDGQVCLFTSAMNVEGGRTDVFFSRLPTIDTAAFTVPATSLGVLTQPAGAVSGVALTTQPVVAFLDADLATVTSEDSTVTAALIRFTGTGTPSGTLSVAASSGLATFTDLTVTSPDGGTFGWRMTTAGGLTIDTAAFTVPATAASAPDFGIPQGLTLIWRNAHGNAVRAGYRRE